ncbi:MAG: FAD-binding oxidoreductase [Acidobacteriia bacterium]|nr:FAD-binding oxidoreductase [Terriglobia bacterium]
MTDVLVQAYAPPDAPSPEPVRDPAILEAYLEDASGNPPGRAAGLLRPSSEREAAAFLRATAGRGVAVLPQAARSSLTGGAVPEGEVVLSVEKLDRIGPIERSAGGARVSAGAGVRLKDLQRELASRGYYYPPVPTYQEAMLGGTVSTNAGGAATFKYGVTRQWVHGLRVLLFNGDLLVLERGQSVARRGQVFRVLLSDGTRLDVPVPEWSLPDLKKISAGYHSSDPLDLVDLFVGSEGTLGLITEATVDLVPAPPAVVTGLVFPGDLDAALSISADLRARATHARARDDSAGPDVRAIELMDGRALALLREHGDARKLRVAIPESAGACLLFELELPERIGNDEAQNLLAAFLEEDVVAPDAPLVRLLRILAGHGALETLDLAFPEDDARREALHEFREAVPKRVNEILAGRRLGDPGATKVGGDLIVPFEHLREMLRIYGEGFSRRGLEFAIWGHVSDGNLHPNALPRSADEARRAADALLEFGDEAVRRGGAPLSEHGVGKSLVKQEMLRRFLGDGAVASMRAIKAALDPDWRFAPGVLFPARGL